MRERKEAATPPPAGTVQVRKYSGFEFAWSACLQVHNMYIYIYKYNNDVPLSAAATEDAQQQSQRPHRPQEQLHPWFYSRLATVAQLARPHALCAAYDSPRQIL